MYSYLSGLRSAQELLSEAREATTTAERAALYAAIVAIAREVHDVIGKRDGYVSEKMVQLKAHAAGACGIDSGGPSHLNQFSEARRAIDSAIKQMKDMNEA